MLLPQQYAECPRPVVGDAYEMLPLSFHLGVVAPAAKDRIGLLLNELGQIASSTGSALSTYIGVVPRISVTIHAYAIATQATNQLLRQDSHLHEVE